MDFLKKHKII